MLNCSPVFRNLSVLVVGPLIFSFFLSNSDHASTGLVSVSTQLELCTYFLPAKKPYFSTIFVYLSVPGISTESFNLIANLKFVLSEASEGIHFT